MPNIISIKDLKKNYNTEKAVVHSLRGINLSVGEGETVAIVGESGAGKSTLLHILGTLESPSSGEVLLCGVNPFTGVRNSSDNGPGKKKRTVNPFSLFGGISEEGSLAKFRSKNIGFVFQFHHLLPEFSALENVMMPPLIRGIKKKQAENMAGEVLCAVGLKERLVHKPSELSGGEQQRVAIARAIVMEPKILLADEPTGNLDTMTSDKIHDLFMDLNENKKITMIIVTHNLKFAKGMKKTITLVDGMIA